MNADALHRLKQALVFDVVEPQGDYLSGLPCLALVKPNGHAWTLPTLGRETDFAIGWEMGLAFLRLKLWLQQGASSPEQLDPAPTDLSDLYAAMRGGEGRDAAPEGQRESFLACIDAYLDHALNARQTLPELHRRLAALDDATLRSRCLAILDGKPVADIFDPKELGFMKLVKPVAPAMRRQGERA